ncbi:hypothetical protein GCM10010967_15290 [Dyadobacter beijingensis]|uniref:Uncharacterized protein n=1 Tax=Dyadobacter beijingensis TaxID=365489 RepID=A0ABQ2HKI7_9BACT|nr:hypothetical protein [Dyadobacter beijingensis]GGM84389.1 hypothetical protein GCM10010967_15290 [Dyadobacter beijingensis]
MIGYSITYLLERSARTSSEEMIGEDINSPNIIIKVPLTSPDRSHWSSSGPIDDHIEGNGQFYQITAQQIVNDTLFVYCQYDQRAREHFADLVSKIQLAASTDTSTPAGDSHSRLLKGFLKDYLSTHRQHVFFVLEWAPDELAARSTNAPFHAGIKPAVALPPPDFA